MGAIDAVLATAAVIKLDGDPLWLMLVGGPGNAKTETVSALKEFGAHIVSTIASEGALLSGTSKGERASDATGGLLRTIGSSGVLVIKDFTSILSMSRNSRPLVLGALREIYDGYWHREIGADGGRQLEWSGRIALIGAVTTAWDLAHAVVTEMGDRFVLLRLNSDEHRLSGGRQAIENTGHETVMRAELAAAASAVLAGTDTRPVELGHDERERLLRAADLVTRARTAVMRDTRGNVTDAHAPEMPTRFARQLMQLVRGGVAIGMSVEEAMDLAIRCARDSVPPLRLAILVDLADHPRSLVSDVRKRLQKPHNTIDRELQALHMLGLVTLDEDSQGSGTRWLYTLRDGIDTTAVFPDLSLDPPTGGWGGTNIPGNGGGGENLTTRLSPSPEEPGTTQGDVPLFDGSRSHPASGTETAVGHVPGLLRDPPLSAHPGPPKAEDKPTEAQDEMLCEVPGCDRAAYGRWSYGDKRRCADHAEEWIAEQEKLWTSSSREATGV